jgi:hypothetical protein
VRGKRKRDAMIDKLRAMAKLLAICWAEEVGKGRTVGLWTFSGNETLSDYVLVVRVEVMHRDNETVTYAS